MRPYRLIFSTLDREGNEVRLTDPQWYGHILLRHPEIAPYLDEIKAVIEDPQLIVVRSGGEMHFLTLGAVGGRSRQYLKVVVEYSDEITGRRIGSVRTAFLAGRHPKGVVNERKPS